MRAAFTQCLFCLSLGVSAQNTLVLEVTMNERAAGGTLRIALCPNASAYDTEQGCVLREVRVTASMATVTFTDLPEGRHAIKAFHDVNDNGELDTNWIGIPTEPYGFSNDAMGTFGPPGFEQASFNVGAGANALRMRMKG